MLSCVAVSPLRPVKVSIELFDLKFILFLFSFFECELSGALNNFHNAADMFRK